MRIRQFVYFALRSDTVSADTLTGQLGQTPDATSVRGSKQADPPRPANHSWKIECRERGLGIDAQIERVLARLRPIAERLASLIEHTDLTASLVIVRYFDDEHGEEEIIDTLLLSDGRELTKLAGQHQLLGWHLEPASLQLLAHLHADIDVDEYN